MPKRIDTLEAVKLARHYIARAQAGADAYDSGVPLRVSADIRRAGIVLETVESNVRPPVPAFVVALATHASGPWVAVTGPLPFDGARQRAATLRATVRHGTLVAVKLARETDLGITP